MEIRGYRGGDAEALTALSATCTRGEGDFVLNPLWETKAELVAEFERFRIDPESHLLVAGESDGEILGFTASCPSRGSTWGARYVRT